MFFCKSLTVSGLTFGSLIHFEFTFVYGVRRASLVAQMVKNPPAVSGLGRSHGGGNGSPLQYSCLGNPTDRGSWQATVHAVVKELVGHGLVAKQH